MRIGIIGGTGFAANGHGDIITVETPWRGVEVTHYREAGNDLFYLKRHGVAHVPPHRIDHRANIETLARCKVDAIFALNAVGALDPALAVPSLLVPDDLIDLRKTTQTFFDDRPVHVDVSEPYCATLRALLAPHANAPAGTYVAVEGPRLETSAEVRMMRALGGSVVGMTGCPEAALARERAICYASLCLVVNAAAGVHAEPLIAQDIRRGAEALAPAAMAAVLAAARALPEKRACRCRGALDGAAI